MNDQTLEKATGRAADHWSTLIRKAGKSEALHKEIAEYLQQAWDGSPW